MKKKALNKRRQERKKLIIKTHVTKWNKKKKDKMLFVIQKDVVEKVMKGQIKEIIKK